MPSVRSQIGRVSDVIGDLRHDWSGVRHIIQGLEPGQVQTMECPRGVSLKKFRSMILIYGRRYHKEMWRLTTHSKGNSIQCFLAPVEVLPGEFL